MYDIRFPNLGLVLKNIKDGFTIFGIEIKYYGVIITLGFIIAYLVISKEAKRTHQDDEFYLDLILLLIFPCIVGARLYYVIFSWRDYFVPGKGFKDTLIDVINTRNGGLAIYGGVIVGVLVTYLFSKKRKQSFPLVADTACIGLLIGQIMGRWGNFFNREAFGEYTDSLLAMSIPVDYYTSGGAQALQNAGIITEEMAANVTIYDNMQWISVHPTFLYESLWNLALLIFILVYRRHKKFDGELILLYIWGYGLGRMWIEGLRTDSLMISFLNIRVSQLLAICCVLFASVVLVKKRMDVVKNRQ